MSVSFCVCHSLCLSLSVSVTLFICLSISVSLSVSLSLSSLSVSVYVSLSPCLCLCFSVPVAVTVSLCICLCPCPCLCVCVFDILVTIITICYLWEQVEEARYYLPVEFYVYLQVEFISEPSVHNHPYLWMLTSMHIDIVLMSFSGGAGPGPTRAWARASERFLNDIHNNNNYYYCS